MNDEAEKTLHRIEHAIVKMHEALPDSGKQADQFDRLEELLLKLLGETEKQTMFLRKIKDAIA